MRKLLFFAMIFAVLALAPSRAFATPTHLFSGLGGDFNAFYCSGVAVVEHRDPYLVEPLRACEERVQPNHERAGVVTPSPLPGYDLALFAALARLPYGLAKLLWYVTLLGSLGLAAFCLTRLTGFPAPFVVLALMPVDGLLNLSFGQVPPIVVAALCLAGYLIERERYVAAAFAAAATLIEPHIGAPACLAMFLFLPRCRLALAACALILAGIAVSVGGFTQNVAYFTTHLPAQARGELVAADQFSLSAILHLLHLPDRLSLALGTLSYVVMAALGIWLGRYSARALSTKALIVFVPAAAVLFAGTYVHDVQFAAALPAAFLLCAKERNRAESWCVLGLLLVPWFTYGTGGHTIGLAVRLLCAFIIGWLAFLATQGRPPSTRRFSVGGGVAVFALLLVFCAVLPHSVVGDPVPLSAEFLAPQASAQDNWGAYLRATPVLSKTTARGEFEKLPFWLGVLGVLFLAADVPIVAAIEGASNTTKSVRVVSEAPSPHSA